MDGERTRLSLVFFFFDSGVYYVFSFLFSGIPKG